MSSLGMVAVGEAQMIGGAGDVAAGGTGAWPTGTRILISCSGGSIWSS
jgi:hypothetical protein